MTKDEKIITEEICKYMDIENIFSMSRKRKYIFARFWLYDILYNKYLYKIPEISETFNVDRTTVHASLKNKFEYLSEKWNRNYYKLYHKHTNEILAKLNYQKPKSEDEKILSEISERLRILPTKLKKEFLEIKVINYIKNKNYGNRAND